MATRRRPSGFTEQEKEEAASISEFLDDSVNEILETLSREEDVDAAPFAPSEIIPTEDVGPRFLQEVVTPAAQESTDTVSPLLQPPPKRHPRNIPKFSRYK
jgi:hypothetical protein